MSLKKLSILLFDLNYIEFVQLLILIFKGTLFLLFKFCNIFHFLKTFFLILIILCAFFFILL